MASKYFPNEFDFKELKCFIDEINMRKQFLIYDKAKALELIKESLTNHGILECLPMIEYLLESITFTRLWFMNNKVRKTFLP